MEGGRRILGRRTAELAKAIAVWLGEQGLATTYEVVCSHRGVYVGVRQDELMGAGVTVRDIGLFMGEDHARLTRIGVGDIAICTRAIERKMIVLLEIEEGKKGTNPKVVLGDAFGPMLADRVDIVANDDDGAMTTQAVSLIDAEIWVAFHPREGDDLSRTERLEVSLNQALVQLRGEKEGPSSIRLFNLAPEELVERLFSEIQCKLATEPGVNDTNGQFT